MKAKHALAPTPKAGGITPMGFHMGHALIRLAATYYQLHDVVMEVIQNAIDAGAITINVIIDFTCNRIEITDNGDGASQAKVEMSLTNIAHSIKPQGKLGRFGLGLISPIGKCKKFTFLSVPKSGEQLFRQWTFSTSDLEKQAQFSGIPFEELRGTRFSRVKHGEIKGFTYVPWRTRVVIDDFSDDKLINRMDADSLAEAIRTKYGVTMRRNDTVVNLTLIDPSGKATTSEVRATDFQGTPLQKLVLEEEHSGHTVFDLLLAPLTTKGRRGMIHFGEIGDDHRLSTKQFCLSTADLLDSEVAAALRSGIFEGEILTEKAKLLPSRRGFEKNEALLGLCDSIEQWFRKVGTKHLVEIQEASRERRYQDLGLRSLRVIEDLVRKNPELAKLLEQIKLGTVGVGHTAPDEPQGDTAQRFKSTQGGTGKPREAPSDSDRERREPQKEKEGHHPGTVAGPEGKPRTIVRDGSFGLAFSHQDLPGSNDIYEFVSAKGLLIFNRRHELFVRCEANDTALMRYQEAVAVMALAYLLMPDDWIDVSGQSIKIFMEEQLKMTVHIILNGDMISGRRAKPKHS